MSRSPSIMALGGLVAAASLFAAVAAAPPATSAAPTEPSHVAGSGPSADLVAQHCDLTGSQGAYRTIALHPSIGGKVSPVTTGIAALVSLEEPLPPGTYRATYLSYDGYPGREWVTQPAEVWEVVFLADRNADDILGVIGPTVDLADGVTEAHEWRWSPDSITAVTTTVDTNLLAIRGAAPAGAPSPNSARPVCLNLHLVDPDPDPQPEPDLSCSRGDVAYLNPLATYGEVNGKVWSRSPTWELARPDGGLAPGIYEVVGGSYDGHDGRAGESWEVEEVWVAEFHAADGRVVAVSEPSTDLPDGDGHDEASWSGSMGRITLAEPVERIGARHAAGRDSAPNSVHAACIGLTPLAQLPDARPASEVPWDEVGRDWLLTVVSGAVVEGLQPQGIYLVDPVGERWLLHASIRDPRVDGLGEILDFSLATREALVRVSGPRDMNHIQLIDLQDGTTTAVTSRIGGDNLPKAQVRWDDVDHLLLLDFLEGAGTRLVLQDRAGTEIAQIGPTYPPGQRLDWINGPGPLELVYTEDFSGKGRGVLVDALLDEERTLSSEDCVPIRWVRAGLVAACDSVGLSTETTLYVIPVDGSRQWPLVDYDVMKSLAPYGFRDLYMETSWDRSQTHLILESAEGQVWRLDRGCGVPTPVELPPTVRSGVDVVGLVEGWVVAVDSGRLIRFPIGGGPAEVILEGVGDVERWDEFLEIGRDGFPAPPVYVPNTCDKRGDGRFNLLTDVRWADHDGYTRVVFDFQDELAPTPSWHLGYVDSPVYPDFAVRPVITGDGLLKLWLNPSSTLDVSDPANTFRTYGGPLDIDVGVGNVEGIVIIEDFEAHLQWIIEVDGRKPFTVLTLTDPPRLVVDILDQ